MDYESYKDWLIPLVLVLLIGGILVIKVFNLYWIPVLGPLLNPGSITRALILTNPDDYDSAQQFATQLRSKVPGLFPVVYDNIQNVRKGVITSHDYNLVILYGDKTKLTPEARSEIAAFVNNGGNLLIVKGAGLKDTEDPYVFGWSVGDLAGIISFAPDCGNIENCNDVSAITVTGSEIGDKITFVPTNWDSPIIKRIGIQIPLEINNVPSTFTATKVQDLANQRIAYLEWKDANGKPHSIPAIITYQSGVSGRIMYLAYNPLDLKQEALFRNAILWVTGKI